MPKSIRPCRRCVLGLFMCYRGWITAVPYMPSIQLCGVYCAALSCTALDCCNNCLWPSSSCPFPAYTYSEITPSTKEAALSVTSPCCSGVLPCTLLHCSALYLTVLYCTVMHCTALHYTTLADCTALKLQPSPAEAWWAGGKKFQSQLTTENNTFLLDWTVDS